MKKERIYCVGIGGAGLSAFAGVLHGLGHSVSGTDELSTPTTMRLKKMGIEVRADSVLPKGVDRVIVSLAIPKQHRVFRDAHARGIKVQTYPEALGALTKKYFTIAICGTHGKTTTTAMIASTLLRCGFDPTVIVGSTLANLEGGNFRVGKSEILVLESCEYERAFLHYRPRVILMHTIDPDHFDTYPTFKKYCGAFTDFAKRLPRDGYFFGNLDDEDVHDIMQNLQKDRFPNYNMFTYSRTSLFSDVSLQEHERKAQARTSASRGTREARLSNKENSVIFRGVRVGDLNLSVPGEHNRMNALAAFSVCALLGLSPRQILASLAHFKGTARRFEEKGKIGKTVIIDDYAHHPVEIRVTLQAARERFPKKKICVVFQPHQYSRTAALANEFGAAFKMADEVVIPNIYAARDTKKDMERISVPVLVNKIKKSGVAAIDGRGIDQTVDYLKKNARKFSVIITMGAGDVWKVAEALLQG